MPSSVEFIGEDGWEYGFEVEPGLGEGLLDIGEDGEEVLYIIKCEADDLATLLYRLEEGTYSWVSKGSFKVRQSTLPVAILTRDTKPYESSIFESEVKRRGIQITHQ